LSKVFLQNVSKEKFFYWVIIPVLNEEESLPYVLRNLKSLNFPPEEIIVVDNGSTDQSKVVASAEGTIVLFEPIKGYGAACLRALEYIKEYQNRIPNNKNQVLIQPPCIVFIDGDGSDLTSDIPLLLQPIIERKVDFSLGSRILGNSEKGALGFIQKWGNFLSCFLLDFLYNKKFTDLGPLRAIRTSTLFSLDMQDRNFGWTVEMQAKIAEADIPYIEIPVGYRKRKAGVSKVSGNLKGSFLAGNKILTIIFTSYFNFLFRQESKKDWLYFLPVLCLNLFLFSFAEKENWIQLTSISLLATLWLAFLDTNLSKIKISVHFVFLTGILLRIFSLFFNPTLTEDFYRTIWDSYLVLSGINPYGFDPYFIQNRINLPEEIKNIIPLMNSINYNSFYLPLQELFSVVIVALWGIGSAILGLKIFFVLIDIGNLYLLRKLLKSHSAPLFYYAWSPFILMEGISNLHFELIVFLFIMLYLINFKSNPKLGTLYYAMAVGTKLIPILFFPYIIFKEHSKRALIFLFFILGIWIYFLIPNWSDQWERGLGLYSQHFEFFSSLNQLLRILLTKFNISYANTGLIVWGLVGFVLLSLNIYSIKYKLPPQKTFFLIYSTFLLGTTVLHPWYIIPWYGLGLILGYRSVVFASFIIFLSYSYYGHQPYSRQEEIVWTSYLLLFIFALREFYEYKYHRNRNCGFCSSHRNYH
jgi:glycosyltransferase involved in cell wall biosynthesis